MSSTFPCVSAVKLRAARNGIGQFDACIATAARTLHRSPAKASSRSRSNYVRILRKMSCAFFINLAFHTPALHAVTFSFASDFAFCRSWRSYSWRSFAYFPRAIITFQHQYPAQEGGIIHRAHHTQSAVCKVCCRYSFDAKGSRTRIENARFHRFQMVLEGRSENAPQEHSRRGTKIRVSRGPRTFSRSPQLNFSGRGTAHSVSGGTCRRCREAARRVGNLTHCSSGCAPIPGSSLPAPALAGVGRLKINPWVPIHSLKWLQPVPTQRKTDAPYAAIDTVPIAIYLDPRLEIVNMTKFVTVDSLKEPIQPSPGFKKKRLADFKLDAIGLCQFGCAYCSSNQGYYLRIRREVFARLTEQQIGKRTLPADDPKLMFLWPDYLVNLSGQLKHTPRDWGAGKTLVYSMLTDGFSPYLVAEGITEKGLRLVLENTAFRIRILTKNAIVGTSKWISFFQRYPGRFVVGLSTGTLDDKWARSVEKFTPAPTARLRALRNLQDAGVPTYGMLCPVFGEVLDGDHLERLVDAVRPQLVDHLWAEPFNDRANWTKVRDCFRPDSPSAQWLTAVFGDDHADRWSNYATELYRRLAAKAIDEGWIDKLVYLLYEDQILESDAGHFRGFDGVLLQSKPATDGRSRNPAIAALQV